MKHLVKLGFLLMLALVSASVCAGDNPVTYESKIEYPCGDSTTCEGVLIFHGDTPPGAPAVLIFPDWMGISSETLRRAKMIADLGYIAFAVDMYGIGVRPQNATEARTESGKYYANNALARERVKAALATLLATESIHINPERVAAIGYCFGGKMALELARTGAPVCATVTFHGGLLSDNPGDERNMKGPVLVLHGADDPYVPVGEVAAFRDEMDSAGAQYELVAYPGAVHSFSNPGAGDDPSRGAAYNLAADKSSWSAMKVFFEKRFTVATTEPASDHPVEEFLPPPDKFVKVEKMPQFVHKEVPNYPALARQAGATCVVLLKMLVDKNGIVRDAIIIESCDKNSKQFEESSLAAAMKCTFKPTIQNGMPVAVWFTCPFEFRLP